MSALVRRALLSLVLGIVVVHYVESYTLPAVEVIRKAVLGEQAYMRAKAGCAATTADDWVHPATLSLTAYGTAQHYLAKRFAAHTPEVLPDYAGTRVSDDDLRCIADFLLTAAPGELRGGLRVRAFRYDIPKASYGIEAGWYSGLAQSFAGQVLLAAYLRFDDERYRVAALEAGNLLQVSVADDGVMLNLGNDRLWFEEYAQNGALPPRVLNGHLLALDFLYWLRQTDPSGPWASLFDAGLRAAVEDMPRYAAPVWSNYDALGNLANHKYQRFHIRQLRRYAQHDPSGVLADAAKRMRWQLVVPAGVFQRLVTQPSRLLQFLIICASALVFVLLTFAARLKGARR